MNLKHPSGRQIEFDESSHVYILDGIKYDSVTTIIHSLFPEFDTESVSKRYAKRHGLDQKDVINEWDQIRETASQFGTTIHKFCENILNNKKSEISTEKEKLYYNISYEFINKLKKVSDIIACEQIIYSPRFKIAGTVDLIIREKLNNSIVILDWKTNKKLKIYNEWHEKGLNGLSHLDNCNFNHYCMQLNMYRSLLHIEGYLDCRNSKMKLLHITQDGIMVHQIPSMNKEIKYVLSTRL